MWDSPPYTLTKEFTLKAGISKAVEKSLHTLYIYMWGLGKFLQEKTALTYSLGSFICKEDR
jgi:hypothetical protein